MYKVCLLNIYSRMKVKEGFGTGWMGMQRDKSCFRIL